MINKTLREAVVWLNEQKRLLGDDLVFSIDDEGYLQITLSRRVID